MSKTRVRCETSQNTVPFDYRHPLEVCIYCFNEDTQRITDVVELQTYIDFHKGEPFKVYQCYCCGARWHWKVNALDQKTNIGTIR